jgi:hypothetical protein
MINVLSICLILASTALPIEWKEDVGRTPLGQKEAQVGYFCQTPYGVCQLPAPQPLYSPCSCGYAQGFVR